MKLVRLAAAVAVAGTTVGPARGGLEHPDAASATVSATAIASKPRRHVTGNTMVTP